MPTTNALLIDIALELCIPIIERIKRAVEFDERGVDAWRLFAQSQLIVRTRRFLIDLFQPSYQVVGSDCRHACRSGVQVPVAQVVGLLIAIACTSHVL